MQADSTQNNTIMSDKEMDIQFDMPKNQSNVIKVIGVGGGGSNAINHMFQQGINGVDFVVCNTDAQALENSPVPTKIQLGVNLTEGLGAGANPQIGEQAALESYEELKTLLDTNTKMIFITAGMGGGTGTGAAPVIAKQAKDMEILTVGIVTSPFKFEGKTRNEQAQLGVEKLRRNVDSLIVINNNKLREVYGNLGFKSGFSKADEVLATASRGIAEVITHHYTQNIDLRDAKTVLSNSGTAIMGSASASGGNRAQEAIEKALDSPLLNDNKIEGAKNVLLLIVSGSEEITIDEIGEINDHIQAEAGNSANIIMGVGEDEDLDESISVTIIATGFDAEQQNEIVNTESKKIIHTLEDEQKAVQNLSPKNSGTSSLPKRKEQTEKPEQKDNPQQKVVHDLGEEIEGNESKNDSPKNEIKIIPTSKLIRDLDVDYEEVTYNEEDFVIIDTNEKIKDIEVNAKEVNSESKIEAEAEKETEQPMFSFDLPRKEEEPQKTNQQPERSKPQNMTEQKGNDIEVRDEIELVPRSSKSGEEKRYSLEDYMEKERELNEAKPEKEDPNEPRVFERKEQQQIETKEENESNASDTTETKEEIEEIDPLNSPISTEMAARASERRARMKKFNYKFRKSNNIDEIEKQPAYKRAGVDLDDQNPTSQEGLSRTSLNKDDDNDEPNLRSNNSFLHDNVD